MLNNLRQYLKIFTATLYLINDYSHCKFHFGAFWQTAITIIASCYVEFLCRDSCEWRQKWRNWRERMHWRTIPCVDKHYTVSVWRNITATCSCHSRSSRPFPGSDCCRNSLRWWLAGWRHCSHVTLGGGVRCKGVSRLDVRKPLKRTRFSDNKLTIAHCRLLPIIRR